MSFSFPSSEINRLYLVIFAAFICILYVISVPVHAETVCGVTMDSTDYTAWLANLKTASYSCSGEIYEGESFPYDSLEEATSACVAGGYAGVYQSNNYFGREYYRNTATPHVGVSGNSGVNNTPVIDATFISSYQLNSVHARCTGLNYVGGETFVSTSGERPTEPTAAFSGSPTSGYPTLSVTFTDASTQSPTSWYWDFGDGNTSSSQNPVHDYVSAGTYTVSLRATNAQGSDWENKTAYVTVNAYSIPSCGYTASAYTGTSPYTITFTDTSGNVPTSYWWNFDIDNQPWISILPHVTNTTQNPVITVSGTGDFYVLHTVTNPAGTGTCPLVKFNISGMAPTPTPTPEIPFPNQTGVCQFSTISLGSQTTPAFQGVWELIEPNGNAYNGFYETSANRLISGQYTNQIGVHIYNEYNLANQLQWRQSYVVEDCYTPTPTVTIQPTPTITYYYPTVTGTLAPNTTPAPITVFQPIPTFSTDLPINRTHTNVTVVRERILAWSPFAAGYLDLIEYYMNLINTVILYILSVTVVALFNYLLSSATYIISLNTQLTLSFADIMSFLALIMTGVSTHLNWKFRNAITLSMTFAIILQIYLLKRGRL